MTDPRRLCASLITRLACETGSFGPYSHPKPEETRDMQLHTPAPSSGVPETEKGEDLKELQQNP